ncbi:MAG TPA: mechanosensitive ion channel domain-containing protein [Terriglobales bacterium]
MGHYIVHWQTWFWPAALLISTILLALVAHRIIFAVARRLTRRSPNPLFAAVVRHGERPAQLILLLAVMTAILPVLPLPPALDHAAEHIVGLGLVACIGWLLIAVVEGFNKLVEIRHSIEVRDNLAARRIRTQVQMLRRITETIVVIVTVAVMLMTFPPIRSIGESILASAGLAALIAGFAARSTLSNFAAGIQVAFTQPIRLGDVVVVEGEWGWIEEINITYVVVRIWDLRRLVVPVSYFSEKPFQNWTRNTADLLGTVFLYTDYSLPVDAVRSELRRILESTKLWDGRVWGLQVTNATDRTMELRALMSAPDSSAAFDLRCYVREKLIFFLQQQFPQCLPKTRAEFKQSQDAIEGSRDQAA